MHIVLLEPEIPYNTGNIGRTCVLTNTCLHLIRPYGFFLDEKSLKRAGMDYWDKLSYYEYDSFEDFMSKNKNANIYMCTTKAKQAYSQMKYKQDDYFMFGKESAGIPKEILRKYEKTCIRIPMAKTLRSLNLSNAASVILYEALRQLDFAGLELAAPNLAFE